MIAWIKARIRVLILDIENYVYLVELNLQYCLSLSVDVLLIFSFEGLLILFLECLLAFVWEFIEAKREERIENVYLSTSQMKNVEAYRLENYIIKKGTTRT